MSVRVSESVRRIQKIWKLKKKKKKKKPLEITDKPMKRKKLIVQLDVKLGHFMEEELDAVLKKLKVEKLLALMKYLPKYGRQKKLMTYFSDYAT